ncbi:MAG TPA: hypothetical protein VGR57_13575 [Ktedonobacterales bacterium]|nr:hypothetical protein [Ktedonobacterales bacterium]
MSQPVSQAAVAAVVPQADLLMRRLQDLEQRLSVEEWWLLGRDLAEAHVLAEVASLLAVARAELDQMLVQYCGRPPVTRAAADDAGDDAADDDAAGAAHDPARLAQQRAEGQQLLQVLAVALPPTSTFARQLGPFAERSGMPAAAVEVLGIVADRVLDAQEAVQNLGRDSGG